MTYRAPNDPKYSDITPKADYLNRRHLMRLGAAAGALAMGGVAGSAQAGLGAKTSKYSTTDTANTLAEITSYNNYYEFGTGKEDPAKYAHRLTTDPWTVEVDGLVDKPGTYDLGDLIAGIALEERIYRMRCVEGWSMVIPWAGVPLASVLNKIGAQSGAKYVGFETVYRPDEMFGQKSGTLNWPYVEGLRMDEAMHPLTLLATGIYDEPLKGQNGAPIRLVVPWKYGFKSIKSISRITLSSKQTKSTWNITNPREYGFYSNVNPEVDHPRWSQADERRIGGGLFVKRIPTQMFNGYADQVAGLYAGMDLKKNF